MGTSSSYQGPKGRTPLLPPWKIELPPEDPEREELSEEEVVPEVTWRQPKVLLGKIGRGTTGVNEASVAALGKSYVRAAGGARAAAASARAGRSTTSRLGGFLSDVAREGLGTALENIGLGDLVGSDRETVVSAIIDSLAPDGGTIEAAAARNALVDTLEYVFSRPEADLGRDGNLGLDADSVREVLVVSIGNYINARLQQDLSIMMEKGTLSENEANQALRGVKEFIFEIVSWDITKTDVLGTDWRGQEGKAVVSRLYREAYALLEANP